MANEDYVRGLERELSYYEKDGNTERAAQVKKELARVTRGAPKATETAAAPPEGDTTEAPPAEAAPKRSSRRTAGKKGKGK